MDLKFKGTKLVGNMYQKFEAICHEVDDFVSQDTVKYVENRVQSVGDSVKRFYAEVVQDMIPSNITKPGNHEAQAVTPTQDITTETQVTSIVAFAGNPVCTSIIQSSLEEYPINSSENTREHLIHRASADQLKLAELDLSLGPEFDASKDKKFHIILEEKDTKEDLVDKKSNILAEENDIEKGVDDEKSVVVVEDAKEGPSQPEEFELICTENKNVNESLLLNEYIAEKSGIQSEVPPATLLTQKEKVACNTSSVLTPSEMSSSCGSNEIRIPEVGLISTSSSASVAASGVEVPTATLLTQKEKVACNTSSVLTPSEMSSSCGSNEVRIPEVGLISTSSSPSMAASGVVEFSDGNVLRNPSDLLDALSSSQSFPVSFSDNKVVDMGLAKVADLGPTFSSSALPLESKAKDAASLDGSSANVHCYDSAQLDVLMSSLEIGEADNCRVDITDPSMETIKLSETANSDEGCVVLGCKLLHADSCRAQRHRSYKKILQDAFASKKRIRKEYEQLGILYGDIDIESTLPGPLNLLPSSSTLDSKKSSSQVAWDPEWELL